ncbi:peptidoglycan D,D-transpeptidase FtsI family protein [Agromyces atrinae]|uniref:Cell division protein FtsI (Penicillin-binding protein 3) n=1 Tax=Agromyces atrinae TaxID=592376 RepID=A0A4Q2M3B7_9MICO|nr:penicillin-binding protein 2 [Agromyces atrinae]NYD65943.1 cell division protein FtsI (penicillin-binding protein 3) [Agromyces atrinae]RXZ86278.1 penicillin-binding protein 2 [Agromyces atrinae]
MNTSRARSRRIFIAAVLLIALVGVFVVRLVDIQVVRAAELNRDAEGKRSIERVIYGTRGDIVDANGTVLSGSVMRYDVTVSPKNARGFERTADDGTKTTVTREQAAAELGAVLGMTGESIIAIIDSALADNPKSDFAYISKQVDIETYRAVEELGIPWQSRERHPSRVYPNGAVAGNLVGFVGDEGDPLAGLELSEDSCLASDDGLESYVSSGADFVALPDSTVTLEQAKDGGQLGLTIDADLQWFTQQVALAQVEATGAQWATVVVQNAKTGELLAVADVPTVDPNNIAATDAEDRGSRSFTTPYEPGSTYKALTAAAVVDAGKATATSPGVIAPYRYLPPNGANINDSSYHEDERMTLTGVLIDSSNTGMSMFGEMISDEQRTDYMKAFGIGRSTEVGFLGEEPGILHDPGTDAWDNQTKYTTMFGQGVATTAVQIASAYQTIANGGVRMPVSLVSGCTAADGTVTEKPSTEGTRVISEDAATQTSQMLERVYLEGWLSEAWNIPGYRVAAKTGTAQVPDGSGGYQSGYLVSVAGFAPADDPQYVVSVSIMDPVKMNSSAASAPVFQKVMSYALKKFRTIPSGAPAPELPSRW